MPSWRSSARPRSHEDDPERAVRAGLRDPRGHRGAERRAPGPDLAVRVGINTGEVVVRSAPAPSSGRGSSPATS